MAEGQVVRFHPVQSTASDPALAVVRAGACQYILWMQVAGSRRVREDWILLGIIAGALVVRLGYLWYYSTMPEWSQLTVDNYYHHHWAQRIAAGDFIGDTTYFRAPFYVWCLALLYSIAGDSLWVARLFGAFIGAASVLMVYLIAQRVFNRTTAIIASALQAIFPTLIYFDGELLLDPLFGLLLQCALYAFLLWYERRTSRGIFIAGLLLGLAAITRPTALVYVAPVVVVVLAMKLVPRQKMLQVLSFGAGVAICVVPIFVRNLFLAGDPVLIASQGGINLYIGNNEIADGLSAAFPEPLGANWRLKDASFIAEQAEGRSLRPGEISDYWSGRAIAWMREHPATAIGLYAKKLVFSVANREISNNRNLDEFFRRMPFLRYHPLSFALIFALAIAGLIFGFKNAQVRILAATAVILIAANAVFFINSRFRLPILFICIVFSAYAVTQFFAAARRRFEGTAVPLVGLVAALAFSYFPPVSFPKGTNVQGLVSQSLYYYSEGNFRRAIELNEVAMAYDPSYPELHLNIGAAYFRLGIADSAQEHFSREIRLHPKRAKGYANLASFYLVNHQLPEARKNVETALSLQPYDIMANELRIRLAAADSSLAVADLRHTVDTAIAETDSNLQIMQDGAAALQARGGVPDAESLLVKSLAVAPPPIETDDAAFDRDFPNSPERWATQKAKSYYLLGYVYGTSGRYAESIEQSRHAIALDSNLAEAYVNLVTGYLSLRDQSSAQAALQQAIVRFPGNPRVQQLHRALRANP